MPNNPGRISGDYSTGEREEVKYAEPPAGFGEVRKTARIVDKKYLLAAAVILVAIWLIIVFR